jgi:signal recognition particle subunit SRP54
MIPDVKSCKGHGFDNDSFKGIEAIIGSMTPEERDNPSVINGSRRKRIATVAALLLQKLTAH